MKLIVCSIYDTKAKAYLRPFFVNATGQAIRSFSDIANDKEHDVGRHPEDYTLYRLGQFDDQNGELMPEAPESLAQAITLIKDETNA